MENTPFTTHFFSATSTTWTTDLNSNTLLVTYTDADRMLTGNAGSLDCSALGSYVPVSASVASFVLSTTGGATRSGYGCLADPAGNTIAAIEFGRTFDQRGG